MQPGLRGLTTSLYPFAPTTATSNLSRKSTRALAYDLKSARTPLHDARSPAAPSQIVGAGSSPGSASGKGDRIEALQRVVRLTRAARTDSAERRRLLPIVPAQRVSAEDAVLSERRRALKASSARSWRRIEQMARLLREAGDELLSRQLRGITVMTDNHRFAAAYAGAMAEVLRARLLDSMQKDVPRRAGLSSKLSNTLQPAKRAMMVWQLADELERWNLPGVTLQVEHISSLVGSLALLPPFPSSRRGRQRTGGGNDSSLSVYEAVPLIAEKIASLAICADDSLVTLLMQRISDAALDRNKPPPPYHEPWNQVARRAFASFLRTTEEQKLQDGRVDGDSSDTQSLRSDFFSHWEHIITTGKIPDSFVQPEQFASFPFPRALRTYLDLELDILAQSNVMEARAALSTPEEQSDASRKASDRRSNVQRSNTEHVVRMVKLLIAHQRVDRRSSSTEGHQSRLHASPVDLRVCIATNQWPRAVMLLKERLEQAISNSSIIDARDAYNLRASVVRLVVHALQQRRLGVSLEVLEMAGSRSSLESGLWNTAHSEPSATASASPLPRPKPPIETLVQLWRRHLAVAVSYRPVKRPVFARLSKSPTMPWLPIRQALSGLRSVRETSVALESQVDPLAALVLQQQLEGARQCAPGAPKTSHRARPIAARFRRIWDSGLVAGVMRAAGNAECELLMREGACAAETASPVRDALQLLLAQDPDKRAQIWVKKSIVAHFRTAANALVSQTNASYGSKGRVASSTRSEDAVETLETGSQVGREADKGHDYKVALAKKIRERGLEWEKQVADSWDLLSAAQAQ